MRSSHALTNLNPRSMRNGHNLRLRRYQLGGRSDPQQSSKYKNCKQILHRTPSVLRARHSKWLTESGNIWNCSLLFIKQSNKRWQIADQRRLDRPKNQSICWPQVNKAQTTRQPPHRPIPVQAGWQKLQPRSKASHLIKSVHNHYFTEDQAHHRPRLRTKRKRIPRVPACYPLTLTPQLTAKMMSNSNLRNSPQPTTTHQQKNRRLQIHPKNRQRLKQLTLLVLAALSPPVNPDRTSTSPQWTSRRYRTWRRQPVKEWPPMKRDLSMPASISRALESALKECKMTNHQTLCNPLLLQIWKWKSLTDHADS